MKNRSHSQNLFLIQNVNLFQFPTITEQNSTHKFGFPVNRTKALLIFELIWAVRLFESVFCSPFISEVEQVTYFLIALNEACRVKVQGCPEDPRDQKTHSCPVTSFTGLKIKEGWRTDAFTALISFKRFAQTQQPRRRRPAFLSAGSLGFSR